MAVRRRKDRKLQYQVYWNNPVTGKRESKSFVSLAEANKHDSLISHQIAHERHLFMPVDEPETDNLTYGQLFNLYLSDKQFSPVSLETTLYHSKPILKVFGQREAVSIEKREVIKLYSVMIGEGVTPSTSHRRMSILRAVLSWATAKELIESNPLAGMRLPKGEPKKVPPPSLEEAAEIMKCAPAHLRRVVIIGMQFGVRIGRSELFAIKWDDVDFDQGILRVLSAKKNPKRPWRDIHIPSSVLNALMWWGQEDSDLKPETIVHWRGVPVASIKNAWKTALKNAKITRHIRPYDLRHAFATIALQSPGTDIKAVADIMGHSDATMILRTYQHVLNEKHKAVLDSMPTLPGTCSGHISEGFSEGFPCAQVDTIQ